jgi:hypothetical protein
MPQGIDWGRSGVSIHFFPSRDPEYHFNIVFVGTDGTLKGIPVITINQLLKPSVKTDNSVRACRTCRASTNNFLLDWKKILIYFFIFLRNLQNKFLTKTTRIRQGHLME